MNNAQRTIQIDPKILTKLAFSMGFNGQILALLCKQINNAMKIESKTEKNRVCTGV